MGGRRTTPASWRGASHVPHQPLGRSDRVPDRPLTDNDPVATNPRLAIAERITASLLRHYPGEIHAIGAHGAVAHRDDNDDSDLALTVVTYRAGGGPAPTGRRVDGVIVDIDVLSAEGMLALACTLTPSWPLLADRYLTTLPLHD